MNSPRSVTFFNWIYQYIMNLDIEPIENEETYFSENEIDEILYLLS